MDFDGQQQLEEERMMRLLALLQKVKRGLAGETEALILASELGLTTEHLKEIEYASRG